MPPRKTDWKSELGLRDLDSFPLTPALSLRERENCRQSVGETNRRTKFESRPPLLPLPRGEGWGEGERDSRAPAAKSLESAKRV